jgi:hypothetical protein
MTGPIAVAKSVFSKLGGGPDEIVRRAGSGPWAASWTTLFDRHLAVQITIKA